MTGSFPNMFVLTIDDMVGAYSGAMPNHFRTLSRQQLEIQTI
jgi:hypothetical protein